MVRGYQLKDGDVFTVCSKNLFSVISRSNMYHIFVPIREYKKIVWYKPCTWFRVLWDIKYIEWKEHGNMDREYLAKLCDARDTLCDFCEANECERCIVTRLIDDAYNEMPDGDGEET